jgi:hypothetical protein
MTSRTAKHNATAALFGPEFYNFVSGRIRSHNPQLITLIASVAAIDIGEVVLPSSRKMKDAQSKLWNRAKRSPDFLPYKQVVRNDFQKFIVAISNDCREIFNTYGQEFVDFILGHTELMHRDGVSQRNKQILQGIDFYLRVLQDSLRY